jgi:hypothetical protein
MHRREFLRNAFGLAAIAGVIGSAASPTQALSAALADPIAAPNKDNDSEREDTANRTDAAADETLEVGSRRGGGRGRGRGRGWGFRRRGWGRRRRVRRGWYRRRRWGWYRRRRRWWVRRRRWWRRPRRRRIYYY